MSLVEPSAALAYYRKNYLFGVARPGALVFDGTVLGLYGNDLSEIWAASLGQVRVKKGMGTLTVSIDGAKASILTAVGGNTSPSPSRELTGFLQGHQGIPGAPSVNAAFIASNVNVLGVGTYAKGQKALREFFGQLGVLG